MSARTVPVPVGRLGDLARMASLARAQATAVSLEVERLRGGRAPGELERWIEALQGELAALHRGLAEVPR